MGTLLRGDRAAFAAADAAFRSSLDLLHRMADAATNTELSKMGISIRVGQERPTTGTS